MAPDPPPLRPGSAHSNLAFDPDLRIPPLQNPRPVIHPHRPSPLEPNARVHEPPHHPKLTSRSKALEEAKLIGEDDELYANDPRRGEGMRKKQKVDIFQLPKPESKPRANKPPPFEPVQILNELHEPPPSAGLFPPITPSGLLDVEPTSPVQESSSTKGRAAPKKQEASTSSPTEVKPKARRKCLRGRLKWTDSETQDLLKGVGMYGVGKWKKILTDPAYSFHPDRTMVDLKDRYRTCRMNEEKAIERKAAEEGASLIKGDRSSRSPRSASDEPYKDATPPEPQFNITTSTSYEESLQLPKPRKTGGANPWTSEEDSNLSRGYQKYGFQWTAIAKDPEFKLEHRTGAQVRDRFRMKYPIVYQSSVPLPLPETGKRAPKKKGRGADDAPNPSQLTYIMHDTNTAPGHASSSSSAAATAAARRPRPALPAIQPPHEQSVPSLSSQGSSPGTPAVMLPDRFSGLHVQPLPNPDAQMDSDDDMEQNPAGSSDRDEPAADAEEVRHLSILGLLNEDNESHERLPSWKYALDDWDSGGGSGEGAGSVTLPPLLSWEEMNGMGMGGRQMFDLE